MAKPGPPKGGLPPDPAVARAARDLIERFGARTFTARLAGFRSIDRLTRTARGVSRLTTEEAARVVLARANAPQIERMYQRARAQGVRPRTVEQALVTWLGSAKAKDAPRTGRGRTREHDRAAIRALATLGYRPDSRAPYLRTRWGGFSLEAGADWSPK